MSSPNRPAPSKTKRPYRRPVLHVYGDIRAITRSVGKTGSADGGMGASMNKTRP